MSTALAVGQSSDIYSLGVLLYELLTGTTPFDSQRFKTAAYDEVRRIIVEEEPTKPSTRLSMTRKARARDVLPHRDDSPSLHRRLRGELDWIVMRCLEKDRNRRYATAAGLAADVQRYLQDEPVQASPPSAWYRFRKLAKRNRVPFVTVSMVALLMLVSIVTLSVSNIRVRQEQARTVGQKLRAEKAEKLASRRAAEITQGMAKLKAANELVDTARFFVTERRWDSASAAFSRAIELRPEHGPAWEGRGDLFASLGLWELAAADLAQAAERHELVTSSQWQLLAFLQAYVGDVSGYRDTCMRMSDLLMGTNVPHLAMDLIRVELLLPDSPADRGRLVKVAASVISTYPHVTSFLHILGVSYYRAGEYELAIARLEESLAADPHWPARAINYPFLAMALHQLGRHDEARQALNDAQQAIDEWTRARYEAGGQFYWVVSQGSTDFWPVPWWDWLQCQLTCDEARRVMGLDPPPEDVRLQVLRARSLAGLRWLDRAVEEYAEAFRQSPDDQQIHLESLRTRGLYHVVKRQWNQAADEYTRASELQPGEPNFWLYRAVIHLAVEDRTSYRRVSAAMLDRFHGTKEPRIAHAVINACTILPDAVSNVHRLVPLGQIASQWYPGSIRMLAAAQCRAGAYEQAVQSYEEAANYHRLRADDLLILAIAHHHAGEAESARECYGKALQWIEQADHRKLDDPAGIQGWGHWQERICSPILRREVESLLNE